jgi:LacI family transcriptional regulator
VANQREIARVLNVNQATVSLALRGDRSISAFVRERVRETAERLGYRPSPAVAMLMSRIRAGRKPGECGVLALVIDAKSRADWYRVRPYRIFHEGLTRRASELGFRVEPFFLRAPGLNGRALDRILQARGIAGVIFAPPYRGQRAVALEWEKYVCVGCGRAREPRLLDRVANDHAQNVVTAFRELEALGYRRIGMSLPAAVADVPELKWMAGYLEVANRFSRLRRIPLFTGGLPHATLAEFRAWLRRWEPDALVTLAGRELRWLEALRLRVPGDIGVACLARRTGTNLAGIDEENDVIGATAVEWVAARLVRNEYGVSPHPKLILIEGRWMKGPTLADKTDLGSGRDSIR